MPVSASEHEREPKSRVRNWAWRHRRGIVISVGFAAGAALVGGAEVYNNSEEAKAREAAGRIAVAQAMARGYECRVISVYDSGQIPQGTGLDTESSRTTVTVTVLRSQTSAGRAAQLEASKAYPGIIDLGAAGITAQLKSQPDIRLGDRQPSSQAVVRPLGGGGEHVEEELYPLREYPEGTAANITAWQLVAVRLPNPAEIEFVTEPVACTRAMVFSGGRWVAVPPTPTAATPIPAAS